MYERTHAAVRAISDRNVRREASVAIGCGCGARRDAVRRRRFEPAITWRGSRRRLRRCTWRQEQKQIPHSTSLRAGSSGMTTGDATTIEMQQPKQMREELGSVAVEKRISPLRCSQKTPAASVEMTVSCVAVLVDG